MLRHFLNLTRKAVDALAGIYGFFLSSKIPMELFNQPVAGGRERNDEVLRRKEDTQKT